MDMKINQKQIIILIMKVQNENRRLETMDNVLENNFWKKMEVSLTIIAKMTPTIGKMTTKPILTI